MNRIFLVFVGACFMSCASSRSASPLFGGKNAAVILETNEPKPEPIKPKIEDKAVVLLNQLFNSDQANKQTVLVINNESDCDFTMNIVGGRTYSVPVGSKKTESIVVDQGEYVMRSEVCKSTYFAKKTLSENTQVSIKYSLVKAPSDDLAVNSEQPNTD